MLRSPIEGVRPERVALAFVAEERDEIRESLCRLGYLPMAHDGIKRALESIGDDPPDCILVDVDDPTLPGALSALQKLSPAPTLLGVYDSQSTPKAMAAMRQGFYDCIPLIAEPQEFAARVMEAMSTRFEYQRAAPDGEAFSILLSLAGKREVGATAEEAVATLSSMGGPCALSVLGRIYPGGNRYRLKTAAHATLESLGCAELDPDEFPIHLGAATQLEAYRLANDIILIRSADEDRQPSTFERLVGLILALVCEAETLRREKPSPERRALLDRLAALSETTRTLHHDINNPLCAISLNAQLLAMALATSRDPKLSERARTIEQNSKKIQQVVDRLARTKRQLVDAEALAPVG